MISTLCPRQNVQALTPYQSARKLGGQWHNLAECERISHFADVSTFGQRFKPLPRTATASSGARLCQLCGRTA